MAADLGRAAVLIKADAPFKAVGPDPFDDGDAS